GRDRPCLPEEDMIVLDWLSHLPSLRTVRVRARFRRPRTLAAWSVAALLAASPVLASPAYYVDNTSSSCSDTGPGTELQPYCTIGAAIAQRGAPGVTIFVK